MSCVYVVLFSQQNHHMSLWEIIQQWMLPIQNHHMSLWEIIQQWMLPIQNHHMSLWEIIQQWMLPIQHFCPQITFHFIDFQSI